MNPLPKIRAKKTWTAATSDIEANTVIPVANIVHQARGRMRLQVWEKRKDHAYFETVRPQLEALADIDEVRVNSITGSIVLLFTLQSHAELKNSLQQLALFEIAEDVHQETTAFTSLDSGLTGIEQVLKSGTAGGVDLRTVAFLGMMGLTIHQILRGNVLGPALPMIWNAYSLIDRIGNTTTDLPPDGPDD